MTIHTEASSVTQNRKANHGNGVIVAGGSADGDASANIHADNAGAANRANALSKDLVAIAAYYRAQARGFAPGHEVDDWLQAEADLKLNFSSDGA